MDLPGYLADNFSSNYEKEKKKKKFCFYVQLKKKVTVIKLSKKGLVAWVMLSRRLPTSFGFA